MEINVNSMGSAVKGNKKILAIVCAGLVLAGGYGVSVYSSSKDEVMEKNNIKLVKTINLSEESYIESKEYSGYVTAKENKNLSFLVGGRISEINVQEGDEVKEGQVLAKVDTSTIQLDIDNSTENINLANSTIEKLNTSISSADISLGETKNSYDSKISQMEESLKVECENYERYKTLYESGAVSKAEFEAKELSYNTSKTALESLRETRDNFVNMQEKQLESLKSDLESANIKLKQSQIALENSKKNLENAVIYAPCDGYVTSIPMKQGEITGAGTPVVVIKGGSQVVNIGVDSSDYGKFSTGMTVHIESNGESYKGTITAISMYPDETTKTYNLEIVPENQNLVLGTLVNVKIPVGENTGVFVPISSVINTEGVNYIYVLSDSGSSEYYNVLRKEVTLGEVDGENVRLEDFTDDAQVIIDGVKYIKETDKVTVNE